MMGDVVRVCECGDWLLVFVGCVWLCLVLDYSLWLIGHVGCLGACVWAW